MLQQIIGENFKYTKLSEKEMSDRRILGRLKGVIADYKNPTRNGRGYGESLWERVFQDDIVKEKKENHCFFGELNHPDDGRTEVDLTKVALCLAEVPKKGSDGKLYGVFDILDTPNGQILKALCDYGCNIGISSRGEGDLINGDEVDPDTYECECWDAVLLPAVKEARLQLVTESYNRKTSLQENLNRLVKGKDEKESSIMRETLSSIKSEVDSYSHGTNTRVNIKNDTAKETVNNRSMVEDIQKLSKENQQLHKQIIALQEKLSICYTKELSQDDAISKYKKTIKQLQDEVRGSSATKSELTESKGRNAKLSSNISQLTEQLANAKVTANKLVEKLNSVQNSKDKLSGRVAELEKQLNECKNLIEMERAKYSNELKSMSIKQVEALDELKTDNAIKAKEYSDKLKQANKLVENYKSIAKTAVNNYIESQAKMLGISSKEIVSKLPNNYSFDDINSLCENLKRYRTSVSKLPFDVQSIKVSAKEPLKESIGINTYNEDDEVDATLLSLADSLS